MSAHYDDDAIQIVNSLFAKCNIKIVIHVSDTTNPLLLEIADRYDREHNDVLSLLGDYAIMLTTGRELTYESVIAWATFSLPGDHHHIYVETVYTTPTFRRQGMSKLIYEMITVLAPRLANTTNTKKTGGLNSSIVELRSDPINQAAARTLASLGAHEHKSGKYWIWNYRRDTQRKIWTKLRSCQYVDPKKILGSGSLG